MSETVGQPVIRLSGKIGDVKELLESLELLEGANSRFDIVLTACHRDDKLRTMIASGFNTTLQIGYHPIKSRIVPAPPF